ncbi:MAG: tripartite tricarboxylate transporter substrate binding protein, partial [Burkholderiales bacterium]
ALPASAAAYPDKPVRFVVPYAPGGGSDIIARIIAIKIGEALGQTFVVDNRPGAASMIATEIVANAPGDGYTLILSDVPHAINAAITSKPTYDPVKDFAPIMLVATTPQILVAHPSFAASSLKELLAMPREQTARFALGTSGTGSSPHMTYELLHLRTGLTLNHVPYKGGGPAISDVVAGQIPLGLLGSPVSIPHLKSGRMKGLGITSAQRHPVVPTVPTFIESGVSGFVVSHWYGVLASGGTPPAVVKQLHAAIAQALTQPDVKERFAALALDIGTLGPDEFKKLIENDVKRWKEVVVKSGIKLD